MHELAVLDAFDGEEVGDGGEDVVEVGHLGLDIKGGRHGELTVAPFIEFFEHFDHIGIKWAISEKLLVGTEVPVHLRSPFRMRL